MRVHVNASAGVACSASDVQWGGKVRRGAGASLCLRSAAGRLYHLALPVALQQARVERARCVDGVLTGEHRVGRAHRALAEPWQGDLPPAFMLFSGGWRRGGPHRAGRHVTARVCCRDASVRHGARRCRHCRQRRVSPAPPASSRLPRPLTTQPPYRATFPEFIPQRHTPQRHAKDEPNPFVADGETVDAVSDGGAAPLMPKVVNVTDES